MPLMRLVTEAKRNTPTLFRAQPTASQTQAVVVQAQPEATQSQTATVQAEPAAVQAQPVPKFIDADAVTAGSEPEPALPTWQKCQYVKNISGKAICTQYSSLCVMEKCKQRYMLNDYFAYKRFMKK